MFLVTSSWLQLFLVTGSWLQVPDYSCSWLQVLGYRFLVTGSWLQVPGYRFLVTGSCFLVLFSHSRLGYVILIPSLVSVSAVLNSRIMFQVLGFNSIIKLEKDYFHVGDKI